MRKVVTIFFLAGLMFFLSLPVKAGFYSPDLTTIQSMSWAYNASGTTSGPLEVYNEGTAIRFASPIQYGSGVGDGWAAVGIGYSWPPPPAIQNLSAYDGVQLNFLNTNNSLWKVNLYMNTGWTDNPYNEQDHYYQDGWIPLLPGETTTVTLDFAAVGAINLNHVTNFGFIVGGDLEDYPYSNPMNPSNPDAFHIDVSTVPEPATICLFGLGALGLLRKRRA
jgi:hypothetical protein